MVLNELLNLLDKHQLSISLIMSLIITSFFIYLIISAFRGIWPFNKKAFKSSFGLASLRETNRITSFLTEAVEKLPKKDHRNEFTRRYREEIDPYFSRQGGLFTHLWIEFKEQLIEPSKQEPFFKNSIRPESFFTLDYLFKKENINFRLLESMPGILVGLGVLGTFVGFSLSILFALSNLLGNGENVTEAVNPLILGAGVAFVTSVCGLLLSLRFNIFLDKKVSALQTLLNKFNSRLEKSLKFITEEYLLTKQLQSIEHQEKTLANMDENIALKIGDHIKQSVSSIGDKIQTVVSQGNQSISEKFLENISNKLNQGIGSFANQQKENVEKTLVTLQEHIPSLVARLEQAQKLNEEHVKGFIKQMSESGVNNQEKINTNIKELLQNMKNEFHDVTKGLQSGIKQMMTDSSQNLKAVISNLGNTNKEIIEHTKQSQTDYQDRFDSTIQNLKMVTDRFDKVIVEANNVVAGSIKQSESVDKVVTKQQNITEKNTKVLHAFTDLSQKLESVSNAISDMTKQLPYSIEQMHASNKKLEDIWNSYEARFESVDEKTKQLFENIKEGLHLISKESTEHVEKLAKQCSQVSNQFAQAIEELTDTVEGFKNMKDQKPAA